MEQGDALVVKRCGMGLAGLPAGIQAGEMAVRFVDDVRVLAFIREGA